MGYFEHGQGEVILEDCRHFLIGQGACLQKPQDKSIPAAGAGILFMRGRHKIATIVFQVVALTAQAFREKWISHCRVRDDTQHLPEVSVGECFRLDSPEDGREAGAIILTPPPLTIILAETSAYEVYRQHTQVGDRFGKPVRH